MIETLLLSVLIIAIAIAFLAVKIILKPGSGMTSMHIHDNKAIKNRSINRVIDQDREDRTRGERVSRRIKENKIK